MKRKKFCVYKISNTINNRVYIGKTSANTDRRWKDHRASAQLAIDNKHIDYDLDNLYNNEKCKVQVIHRAMAKYGIENFQFEILKYYDTEDAAYAGEIKIIKKYNSYKNGYNMTPGGRDPGGIARLLEPKQVIGLFRDYVKTDMCSRDLMNKYNLAKACILSILHRQSYIGVPVSDYPKVKKTITFM